MDTTAYLTRQGWLGTGHPLHPTGRGMKKPLLVSAKLNVLGIGKKKNDAHADQWWARAFDSSLKNLNVGRDGTAGIIDSVRPGSSGVLEMIHAGGQKWASNGGLYAGFVKGEGLRGTITPEASTAEILTNDAHENPNYGDKLSQVRERRKTDMKSQKAKELLLQYQKKGKPCQRAVLPSTKKHESTAAFTTPVRLDSRSHDEEILKQSRGNVSTEAELTMAGEHSTFPEPMRMSKRRRKKKNKQPKTSLAVG